MKLETFFDKFDQFADAPDAVARMRELVLQLAISGELIDQSPDDVPSLNMLQKATRALLPLRVNSGRALPDGWCSVPLGCVIASNTGGGTPSKDNPSYWGGSIPWASVKDIREDKYLHNTVDTISEEGLRNSSSNLIPPDRLLVVTRMGLGKLTINKVAVAINQDLRAIEPNECLDLEFSYLLFKSLKLVGKGVTVKGITIGQLHSLPISLPPFAEQGRIVAKVDELMALCDRLEEQQREREMRYAALSRAAMARFDEAVSPANLNFLFHPSYSVTPTDLRKIVLNLAVQGKLVCQDPTDEPAQKLLKMISGKYGSRSRRRPLTESIPESLSDLPPGWCWARFPELGEFGRGKSKHRPRNDRSLFVGGKFPLVQTGDVARSNGTILTFTGLYNDVGLAQSKM